LLDAVSRICYELPVVGADVVEVSPPYDHAEITAFLGNRVVLEALSGIARRRKDDGRITWDRATPLLRGRGTGARHDTGNRARDTSPDGANIKAP
jgi:agmatinase